MCNIPFLWNSTCWGHALSRIVNIRGFFPSFNKSTVMLLQPGAFPFFISFNASWTSKPSYKLLIEITFCGNIWSLLYLRQSYITHHIYTKNFYQSNHGLSISLFAKFGLKLIFNLIRLIKSSWLKRPWGPGCLWLLLSLTIRRLLTPLHIKNSSSTQRSRNWRCLLEYPGQDLGYFKSSDQTP